MKPELFHAPLSCSLASRFALIAADIPHDLRIVRTTRGENTQPEYLAVNPLGKVPALRVDGVVLTESTAILPFIAGLKPGSGLMPEEPVARARTQSTLGFLSSSVHAAWTAVLRPDRFTTDAAMTEAVREAALTRLGDAFEHLEKGLPVGGPRILGGGTVCDLYLAVFLIWRGAVPGVADRLPPTPGLDAVLAHVLSAPALAAALQDDMALRSAG